MSNATGNQIHPTPEHGMGFAFPQNNPLQNYRSAVQRTRVVFEMVLEPGADQAVTDGNTRTFTIIDRVRRGLVVDACFIVDPAGIAPDASNYVLYTLKNDSTELCEQSSVYGVVAGEPMELTRKNTVANRTLAAADAVTLVVTATGDDMVVHKDTRVFVVCSYA